MANFIWVRERGDIDHYINVNHIARVTKVPPKGHYTGSAYMTMSDGKREITLSLDEYDTADDVIAKIQQA